MTRELARIISQTDAQAQAAVLKGQRLTKVVDRMRRLATLDEWTIPQELEWAALERIARGDRD